MSPRVVDAVTLRSVYQVEKGLHTPAEHTAATRLRWAATTLISYATTSVLSKFAQLRRSEGL